MPTSEKRIVVYRDLGTEIFVSRLSGSVTTEDIEQWKGLLTAELERVPRDGRFKLLSNLQGYEPASLDAHKAFRSILPEILMHYGFRPAFLDLFGVTDAVVQATRGVVCTAIAHVHHDAEKMNGYQQDLGRPNEQFFTDADAAEAWLREQA
jgi:hypothetical protein